MISFRLLCGPRQRWFGHDGTATQSLWIVLVVILAASPYVKAALLHEADMSLLFYAIESKVCHGCLRHIATHV